MLNVLRERSESNEQRKQELKSLQSSLRKQKEEVAVRFGLGTIPEDVYKTTIKHLEGKLGEIEDEIAALQKQNSNRESLVDDILSTACHLDTLWQQGDYRTKQRLQKLIFPDGLIYDRTTSAPRTASEHLAFAAFRSISNEYRIAYNAKAENSVEFSAFFEPRSGEGRISGRDGGVSDANDESRRRNGSVAAFSLTGRCRASDRGLKSIATKKEKVSDFLFF